VTKLRGTLPKGEANGLDSIARDLVHHPDDPVVVIAVIDCHKIVTDVDTGEVEPTARILRIERLLSSDLSDAERLLRRALGKRSGATTLPLDLEDEIRAIFGPGAALDTATGELTLTDDLDDDGEEP